MPGAEGESAHSPLQSWVIAPGAVEPAPQRGPRVPREFVFWGGKRAGTVWGEGAAAALSLRRGPLGGRDRAAALARPGGGRASRRGAGGEPPLRGRRGRAWAAGGAAAACRSRSARRRLRWAPLGSARLRSSCRGWRRAPPPWPRRWVSSCSSGRVRPPPGQVRGWGCRAGVRCCRLPGRKSEGWGSRPACVDGGRKLCGAAGCTRAERGGTAAGLGVPRCAGLRGAQPGCPQRGPPGDERGKVFGKRRVRCAPRGRGAGGAGWPRRGPAGRCAVLPAVAGKPRYRLRARYSCRGCARCLVSAALRDLSSVSCSL